MTATMSGPARTWAATHRTLFAVAVAAVALMAAIAIFLVVSAGPSSTSSRSSVPAEQELTDTQRLCQLARVMGC